MKHFMPQRWMIVPCLLTLMAGSVQQPTFAKPMEGDGSPWRVGVSAGWLDLEGDEPVRDSSFASLHLGYATSERWTLEGVLDVVPKLDESFRVNWSDGARISRLEEESKPGVHDTSSARFSIDGLYSLAPDRRVEPYVGVGAGVIWYEEDFYGHWEPAVRLRAGCQYHLDSSWAIQAILCAMLAGGDVEANSMGSLGIVWRPGKPKAPHIPVTAAPPVAVAPVPPSDDTDGDGLTDRAERDVHHTDPSNADTDYDGLTDSQELTQYHTDPLQRDTDKGGVADGHEVIEDHTNPLQGTDDLQFFELHMSFDPDSWTIRAEYLSELDAIGRILKDDPSATARIEGHVDRKENSIARNEKRLTQKRADEILKYFAKNLKLSSRRLTAAGYGFDRPKAANDPVSGNPQNSRMEIYIRSSNPAPKASSQP